MTFGQGRGPAGGPADFVKKKLLTGCEYLCDFRLAFFRGSGSLYAMKMNNVNIEYQDCGTSLCVVLEGNDKDIETRFNSFWNHGATKGELKWTTSTRAYFWTTEERFRKALTNGVLFYVLNNYPNKFKGVKGGALPNARKIGSRRFDNIPRKAQLVKYNTQGEEYGMGTITAEFNDDCDIRVQNMIRSHSYGNSSHNANGGHMTEKGCAKIQH